MIDPSAPSQPLAAPPGTAPAVSTVLPTGAVAAIEIGPLIVAHHAGLYRYAFRLAGSQADAEDLTQQAFLIAQQKLHQLRDADRAGSWLYAVLRSCYSKQVRKRLPMAAVSLKFDLEQVAAEEVDPETLDREALQAALADLPDEFRVVVLMFYFEDLSYKEIAEQLETPIGTVMSRLSRGKQFLRSRLAAQDTAERPATVEVSQGTGRSMSRKPSESAQNL